VTVFAAVAAALTMTPAMLLTFPTFFGSNRRWGCSIEGCGTCCRRAREVSICDSNTSCAAEQEGETMPRSLWQAFGERVVQRFALPVLLALALVVAPFAALSLPRFTQAAGLTPLLPSGTDTTQTLLDFQSAFGVGALFPTSLLLIPPEGTVVTEESRNTWLQKSCEALQVVAADVSKESNPAFTASAFTGVMIVNGGCTTTGLGKWSDVGGPFSATEVQITYPIDPYSSEGQAWLTRMRDAIGKHTDISEWHLVGDGAVQMDAAGLTIASFPRMIILMMLAVFVLIGTSFGSALAPIRAVLCLLWMLAMTFGLAVFVFQDGWLDFLHLPQLEGRASGAMSWVSPCVACSVVVGLGLDYDIFYSERVLEECEHGYSEKEAAVRALSATANTISAAGVIMILAFGSLLLGTSPVLNEIAFILIIGVLIDCLITTKVIIPAVISLLGKMNFWPRSLQKDDLSTGLVS